MHIKEVIIDGFKSYANRTEIKNFDHEFNAITGLNGSGKSNILDSICFVLGISNLSQVRVNSLQELIYKNGQAGITKATVSVIFDNTLKSQTPIGFEDCDEIVITRQIISGGKNKYLINSYNATNSRVNDLFRSVNLNVNNPHFLIMQGRITKVLNMKSVEILSLIEETVGTKLYDSKRNSALKIIEKKDGKLEEINKVIKDEIMPMLDKLNNDKSAYLEYQKINQDLEHYDKIHKAYVYSKSQNSLDNLQQKLEETNNYFVKTKSDMAQADQLMTQIETHIINLEKKLGKDKGSNIDKLETNLGEVLKEQSKAESRLKNMESNLASEKQRYTDTENAIIEEVKLKDRSIQLLAESTPVIISLEDSVKSAETAHEKAQSKLEACNTGMFDTSTIDENNVNGTPTQDGGESLSLTQHLIKLKTRLAELEREREQADMRVQHAKSILSGELEKSCNITGNPGSKHRRSKTSGGVQDDEMEYKENYKLHQSIRKTLDSLQNELAAHPYTLNPGLSEDDTHLIGQLDVLSQKILAVQNEISHKEDNYPTLRFDFQEFPGLNSTSPKIKGKIMNLITGLGENNARYCRAVEVAAGGKLNFVVVDNEQTGKAILKNGKLPYRTTFIPLNKISPRVISPNIVEQAIQLGGGRENVRPIMDIIQFANLNNFATNGSSNNNSSNLNPSELLPALQFVFGSTLLCKDIDTAKRIAFHPSVRQRCVTLDGDVIEPHGTVSGGYHNPSSFSPLAKCLEINAIKMQMVNLIGQRESIASQVTGVKEKQARFKELHRLLELKTRDIEILDFKMKNNPFYQRQQEDENTKKIIEEETQKMSEINGQIKQVQKSLKDVEKKLGNIESYQEAQIKAAKELIKKTKLELERAQNKLKDANLNHESIAMTIQENEKNIANFRKSLLDIQNKIESTEKTLHTMRQEYELVKANADKTKAKLDSEKAILMAGSKELNSKITEKRNLVKSKNEKALVLQNLEQDRLNITHNIKHNQDMLNKLSSENKWIQGEIIYFGKPNTIYDFSTMQISELEVRLVKLRDRKHQLSRLVNNRALSMLESVKEKYNELMSKKRTLLDDKRKIEELITELDDKKRQTIQKAYVQVNKDFGSIFSTLLPGASAKLVAPEGQTILQGLEIKVSFNDVWKESLTELSGGQRSLIALSLILALLLFKPAPIYILDEIDAALDASHTQNIGVMLSRHFKQSQFIVVSLKDGMFQNANVLFKTSLVEGRSTVARYTK